MSNTTSNVDKLKPSRFDFRCPCGVEGAVEIGHRPVRFAVECPNPECRRVYEIDVLGRRREPAPELRLAAGGA